MHPYKNKRSGLTNSTGSTTITTTPFTYATQTDFATKISNTIKDLINMFDDKHAKQDEKFKETIE